MSLGDAVLHALPDLRLAAESLMLDEALVQRPGASTFDPGTGLTAHTWTTVHTGRCRVRQMTAMEAELLFGEEQLTRSRFVACFPHDTTGFRVDDVVSFTSATDPDLYDRRFRITAVPLATITLYKGFPCEVVEG